MEKLKIAVLGGSGDLGFALAARLAREGLEVLIGSRVAARAVEAARKAEKESGAGPIRGLSNREAARHADWVILALPYDGFRPIVEEVRGELRGKIVIDVMNPIDAKNPRAAVVPPGGSATEQVQALLGQETAVVGAFKHLSAEVARRLDSTPEGDVLLCGDDRAAKRKVAELVRRLGMHPLDAGPKENARVLEGLTALLIGLNMDHKVTGSGVRITGLPNPPMNRTNSAPRSARRRGRGT